MRHLLIASVGSMLAMISVAHADFLSNRDPRLLVLDKLQLEQKQARDADLRRRFYENIWRSTSIPGNLLMALCEDLRPEGLDKESACVDEWAQRLSDLVGDQPNRDKVVSAITTIFGEQKEKALYVRAREILFEVWPEEAIKR